MNRDFKGIWIPREIWLAQGLAPTEKILWAEINSLHDREKGGCYASNEYLMQFMGIKERRLQEMISNLKSYGLIEQVSFDGRERIIKAITPAEGFVACRSEVQNNAPLGCGIMHPSDAEYCTPPKHIYTSLVTSINTPPIPPLSKPADAEEAKASENENLDSSNKKPKRVRAPSDFSPKVKEVGDSMINALVRSKPNYVPPRNLTAFLTHIDYLLRLDNRDVQLVVDVFSWALADAFWCDKMYKPNPAEYLRKQFDQLEMKMKVKPLQKERKFSPSSNDARALEKMLEWEKGAL
jgi:hypothetical protein